MFMPIAMITFLVIYFVEDFKDNICFFNIDFSNFLSIKC